jgi:hypothetical protein
VARPVVLTAVLLVFAAPAAAGPEAIGGPGANTIVGAVKGWTVWSEKPRGAPDFSIVVVSPAHHIVSRPDVPHRSVPFDLDAGVDAHGAAVAAYSRCRTEPAATGGANPRAGGGAPQYTTGRGCSLRLLDLLTGRERRVAKSPKDESEVLPSLHGRTLAYVAVPKAGSGRAVLMVRDMKTGRRTRLFTGTRRHGTLTTAEGPTSVDTDGRSVTSAWRHRNRRDRTFDSDVLVQKLGARKPTVVASATNTEDTPYVTALAPTLVGGRVHYLVTFGRGFCERRFTSRRRTPVYGLQNSQTTTSPVSAAVDGGRLVVVEVFADKDSPGLPTTLVQIVSYPEGAFTSRPHTGQVCA